MKPQIMWAVKTPLGRFIGFGQYTDEDKRVLDACYWKMPRYRIVKVQVTEMKE